MKILKEKRQKNTVSLEIEASITTIEQGIQKVFRDVVKTAKVPGFRQGKVPQHIFEKHYGREMLLKDGISEAVNMAYVKAIQENKLDVVDYPKNLSIGDYKENSPITFTCDVDVKPEIRVDKYKGLKVEKESTIISDDLIDAQLKQLQNSGITYELTDRSVQKEDLLKVNVKAFIKDEPYMRWTKDNVGVGVGSSIFSEKFDENLIGHSINKDIVFSVKYAKDYHIKEVADQNVSFTVVITEIKEKKMPELTDELVQQSTQFKTVAECKDNIRKSLEDQRQKEVDEKVKTAILDQIIEKTKFDIPEGMINYEIEQDKRYMESNLKQSGMTIETYLQMVKQSEEEFNTQLKTTSEKRVKQQLILEAIEKKEQIEATQDDIHAEIKRLKPDADTTEKIEKELKKVNQDGLKKMIQQRKVFEFLVEHAKITEKKSKDK